MAHVIATVRPRIWEEPFLAHLEGSGNVAFAAKKAKIGIDTAYAYRRADPEFAAKWKEAKARYAGGLIRLALSRAKKGTPRQVVWRGQVQGIWLDKDGNITEPHAKGSRFLPTTYREINDNLLVTLLKAAAPHEFDRRAVERKQTTVNIQPVSVLEINVTQPAGQVEADAKPERISTSEKSPE